MRALDLLKAKGSTSAATLTAALGVEEKSARNLRWKRRCDD